MKNQNTPIRSVRIAADDWDLIGEAAKAEDSDRGQYIRRVCVKAAKRTLKVRRGPG